ncbi:HupE/UreJ family protein [Jannaschia sp. Os4]|uniref:HupE/UreJ family protein n=1 Tax=Jannaschia sp. Os4 TaxID=2807617 RepID=UPI00193AAFFF|nr:HupE/UreJ family protein [Jannaschia sp. Os4]MBM2574712.1 HupE/UreJ family protein [Jannaschia sp. Os4]
MTRFLAALGATLIATPALAHHPLGGLPMTTFAEGALSGVGHPVLGFDHLFFVVAVGLASAFLSKGLQAPLAYVGAMLAGTLAVSLGLALPLAEVGIVASLVVLGGLILTNRLPGAALTLTLVAGFGLFHGAGFAGSILGQEGGASAAVMLGYLAGLGATQYAIAVGVAALAARADRLSARLAGAAVAGVGTFLLLEVVEGPLVALIAA